MNEFWNFLKFGETLHLPHKNPRIREEPLESHKKKSIFYQKNLKKKRENFTINYREIKKKCELFVHIHTPQIEYHEMKIL